MNKKVILFLLLIILGGISLWYINYPAHEKRATDRIQKYMEAQGIDKSKISDEISSKDTKSGRWSIVYKFEDEQNLTYEYLYDKETDAVLLTVYETPHMNSGHLVDIGTILN